MLLFTVLDIGHCALCHRRRLRLIGIFPPAPGPLAGVGLGYVLTPGRDKARSCGSWRAQRDRHGPSDRRPATLPYPGCGRSPGRSRSSGLPRLEVVATPALSAGPKRTSVPRARGLESP